MAKIYFNQQNEVDMPTLLLQNRNFDTLGGGSLNKYASEFTYKEYFNGANELSFKSYKTSDGIQNPLWDYIVDCKIVYIPSFDEKFEIKIAYTDEDSNYKIVTGTALAESELSQVKLYTVEINTSDDIARSDYDENFPTLFYRIPDISFYDWSDSKYANYTDEQKLAIIKGSSLLHRLLEKAYNYSIGYVDTTLSDLTKIAQFSIDDVTIYDELTGDISDEYGVLFKFDSVNRTVSAYDLYNTCNACGYRGDFSEVCPECGSTDFGGQYGSSTTIMISDTNLATQIQKEGDIDSLKNTFRVEGGDDNMTAVIASVNPNGSNYIYYFSEDTKSDMSDELVNGLESYNELYTEYQTTNEYVLSDTNVSNYNGVIDYIKTYFPDSEYETISSLLVGYGATTNLLYDSIDLELFLQTSMMPTITIDNLSIEETMALLIANHLSPVAITDPQSSSANTLSDNAVLGMAKVLVNTALYDVEISESIYTSGTTGTWVGKFKLTSIEDETETLIGDSITISITSDMETYITQKIERLMKKSDVDEALDLTNMDLSLDDFKLRLHYYGITPLQNLYDEFENCIGVILDNKTSMGDLYDSFYNKYYQRMLAVNEEADIRKVQLESITAVYNEIINIRSEVKTALNLQNHLGTDLWTTFCSYRREDKYSNDNYVSDGLTNAEIITKARELFTTAQQELYKAGTIQYSMSTTMNNLLMIEGFESFVDTFEVGNWLNVKLDDINYRLRLLSYEIDFDNLEQINVDFSTVDKIWNGISDVKSVIDSARSIAGSYSGVTQQVYQSTETTAKVNNWVNNGLATTSVKIVNAEQNATIQYDKNGMLLRSYDDIAETYADTQTKILPSGIYVTDNAWENVKTALGKYSYVDPLDGDTKIAFGLIAETIIGQLILSEKNIVTNGSGSITMDENGIKMVNNGGFYSTNGTYSIEIDPNHTFSNETLNGYLICVRNGENVIMGVDINGDGYFNGEISASSGYVAAWEILPTGLFSSMYNIPTYNGTPDGLYSDYTMAFQPIIYTPETGIIPTEEPVQELTVVTNNDGTTNVRVNPRENDLISVAYLKKETQTSITGDIENLFRLTNYGKLCCKTIQVGTFTDITADPIYISKDICVLPQISSKKIIPVSTNLYSNGDSSHLWTSIYATNGTIQTSDKTKKRNIQSILPIYETMFMKSVPVQYLFNDGDRIHFGIISQDFEALLKELCLTALDCAAFCKDIHYIYDKDENGRDIESTKRPETDENGNIVYDYAFRYSEFIMLTVHMVQKTILRVDGHDTDITELQTTIQSQQETIQNQQTEIDSLQETVESLQDKQKSLETEQERQNKIIQALCIQLGLDTTAIA